MGRQASAILGTCAVHAIIVAAWFAIRTTPPIDHRDGVREHPVELVELIIPPATVTRAGGSARLSGSTSASHTPAVASPASGDHRIHARRAQPQPVSLAAVQIDHGNEGDGTDGDGTGHAAGHGGGIGDGIGLGLADLPAVTPSPRPPAAPIEEAKPASRARPARLIFPSRQREIDDDLLFVARLVVDDDGFVVGARLVRGFGGRRDQVATDAVWRFRYDPAWDAGGRPITSTVEQRFHVSR